MPKRVVAAAGLLSGCLAARAQVCTPVWATDFASYDPDDGVYVFAEFDDGRGRALYAGGRFTHAGGVAAPGVARWDGRAWEPLAGGLPGTVWALAVYDDGTGEALYAAGRFTEGAGAPGNNIARWNGAAWQRLGEGVNENVGALKVFDDGKGPALYLGGNFTAAGGLAARGAARWDGQWSTMEGGLLGSNLWVSDLEVYDDGNGPALYYGGRFEGAGALASPNVVRWDGTRWAAVPPPPSGDTILGLATWTAQTLPLLVALGRFGPAGSLATFDGTRWSTSVLFGPQDAISLASLDDGSGPALYVGEVTQWSGPDAGVKRWRGLGWEWVGPGLATRVESLTVFDDGRGPALCAGGDLTRSGGTAVRNVARWDGSRWSTLDLDRGAPNGPVSALAAFDDGGEPTIIAGGAFTHAGDGTAPKVALWDGEEWAGLGDCGLGAVSAVTAMHEPAGTRIYAGGGQPFQQWNTQPCLARWDGSAWALVPGVPELLNCFDCGPQVYALLPRREGIEEVLYVAGCFHRVGGIASASIARWDGREWSGLGTGLQSSLGQFSQAGRVYAVVEHDDGTGPSLFAGGSFAFAGGAAVRNTARWDGQRWWPVGTGVVGLLYAMTVHDEGGRAVLVAGGRFSNQPYNVVRWDGAQWTPMPGLTENVYALRDFDAGDGPALHAGGDFVLPGGERGLARWDGVRWLPHEGGIAGSRFPAVRALAEFPGPEGPGLFVGGSFSRIGGVSSSNVALWRGCADFCYADCDTSTGRHALDIFDFLCFQNHYAAANPYACDCDTGTGPGECDIFDYICFLNLYDAGCP